MELRVPPHSVESEKHVLASMIQDNKCISMITSILTPNDYYNPDYKRMHEIIVDLYNDNKPIDIITVSDKMGDEWLEHIATITGNLTTSANVKHYALIVKGKSVRRQYIEAAKQVIDASYDGLFDNIVDFKNDVLQKMDIDVRDGKKEQSKISDIVSSTMIALEKRYNTKDIGKKKYGYDWLDKMTGGAHDTDLTFIAARPSVGKTTLAINIARNMAFKGNNAAIFSLEMSKEQLVEKMIAMESNVDSQKIRRGKDLDETDWQCIWESVGWLGSLPVEIYDNIFTIQEIRSECRSLKNNNKLDIVFIDYLQLMHSSKKSGTRREEIESITRSLKMMAKELNVPVVVLSQLTRANEQDNRRPKLIDLRESGSIEQDADNVIFLHDENYGKYGQDRDDEIVPIELILAKQRNGKRDIYTEIGFRKTTQRFVNLEVRKNENNNTQETYKGKQRKKMPYDD